LAILASTVYPNIPYEEKKLRFNIPYEEKKLRFNIPYEEKKLRFSFLPAVP
jgi:hypothetical protein